MLRFGDINRNSVAIFNQRNSAAAGRFRRRGRWKASRSTPEKRPSVMSAGFACAPSTLAETGRIESISCIPGPPFALFSGSRLHRLPLTLPPRIALPRRPRFWRPPFSRAGKFKDAVIHACVFANAAVSRSCHWLPPPDRRPLQHTQRADANPPRGHPARTPSDNPARTPRSTDTGRARMEHFLTAVLRNRDVKNCSSVCGSVVA